MQLISIGQFHKVIEKYYQCDCLSDVEVGTADSGMDVI